MTRKVSVLSKKRANQQVSYMTGECDVGICDPFKLTRDLRCLGSDLCGTNLNLPPGSCLCKCKAVVDEFVADLGSPLPK